jgi:hypothetical protein
VIRTPEPGRAEVGLVDAARAAIRQWSGFIGDDEHDGDEDAWAMGGAIRRLAEALAEIGAVPGRPLHLMEVTQAVDEVRRSGRPAVLTDHGEPALLILPPGTSRDPAATS